LRQDPLDESAHTKAGSDLLVPIIGDPGYIQMSPLDGFFHELQAKTRMISFTRVGQAKCITARNEEVIYADLASAVACPGAHLL
jgi:hypothetical protein